MIFYLWITYCWNFALHIFGLWLTVHNWKLQKIESWLRRRGHYQPELIEKEQREVPQRNARGMTTEVVRASLKLCEVSRGEQRRRV